MNNLDKKINELLSQCPVEIQAICASLGIRIKYDESLRDDISGYIHINSDFEYEIGVNSKHPPTRQRFTIAHELGHYIKHNELIGAKGIIDGRLERSERENYSSTTSRQEAEANAFAAQILMPTELLVDEYRNMTIPNSITLAQKFAVSQAAMRIRMEILQLEDKLGEYFADGF